MSSTLGTLFRVTTFGESHGPGLGVVIDGCPGGLRFDVARIGADLRRRQPGQSSLVSQRREPDEIEVLAGVGGGVTLGSPIALFVRNVDARSGDYQEMANAFRPSHGDYTWQKKFGTGPLPGGGRLSARETVARVAAGAVARLLLEPEIDVVAWVQSVATIDAPVTADLPSATLIDASPVRCPDAATSAQMVAAIEAARKSGDSLGGVICAAATGVEAGLGAPIFDKLEADLAKAILSIPACRGFEIGSGFAGTRMRGSEHNDAFLRTESGAVVTRTNHSGGIQGGISNGMPITLRAAFKPTATIMTPQDTVDLAGQPTTITGRGRHDPCVLPRAVPIVEAMIRITLADHLLRARALRRYGYSGLPPISS